MTFWAGRRVILGVSGGIACYKSCVLARRLVEAGAQVDVVMTRAAQEFVRPLTFEALTGRPVLSSLWERGGALQHVRLGQDADLIVVAPATAQLLARLAQGAADDILTALLLASTAPILVAPAMNDAMFAAESTQRNLGVLLARGVHAAGPAVGELAEGPSDRPGRMLEPEDILRHAERVLRAPGSALQGRRVVITAGPTREALDPVRVLTNRSSGRTGVALAEAAWARGADVQLLLGPTALACHDGIEVTRVDSTRELETAVAEALDRADVLIMAAAPADFAPADRAERKRPRGETPEALSLVPTADILNATRGRRQPGAVIAGFALETGDAEARARAKLDAKGLDLIVVNDALEPGAGFEVLTNRVTVIHRDGRAVALPFGSKRDVADGVLDEVERHLV